jgi:hypothetical protein
MRLSAAQRGTANFFLATHCTIPKMRKRGALNFSPRFAQKHFL